MNGLASINVGGKIYPLLFGVAATQEIAKIVEKDYSDNEFTNIHAIIHGGMINHAIKARETLPSWTDTYEVAEAFYAEKDFIEQFNAVNKIFAESRWGSDYLNKLEDLKKKVDKQTEEVMAALGGSNSENTA